MSAGRYDFVLDRGATVNRTFQVTDMAGGAVSYNGFTARMQVRKEPNSPVVLLTATTESGHMQIVGNLGQINLVITDDETSGFTPGTYYYDLFISNSLDESIKLLEGRFIVHPSVTRLP